MNWKSLTASLCILLIVIFFAFVSSIYQTRQDLQNSLQQLSILPTSTPLLPTPTPRNQDIIYSLKYNNYRIEGTSLAELRNQMTKKGPKTPEHLDADAYTTWTLSWDYDIRDGLCSTDYTNVYIDVEIILPVWQNYDSASQELKTRWDTYLNYLKNHENGHRDHGVSAGREFLYLIKQLHKRENCNRLDKEIEKISDTIMVKYGEIDKTYDQYTQSHPTYDAYFP